MREAQITDWIGDLLMFGSDIVSKACGEWRRTQAKRPTIADIRKLCIEFHATERAHHAIVDGRSDPHEAADRYARSAGWASALERQDAIEARQEAYRSGENWRKSPEAQLDPAITGAYANRAAQNTQSLAQITETGLQVFQKGLGIKAREYTAEEMAEARKQVGIE